MRSDSHLDCQRLLPCPARPAVVRPSARRRRGRSERWLSLALSGPSATAAAVRLLAGASSLFRLTRRFRRSALGL